MRPYDITMTDNPNRPAPDLDALRERIAAGDWSEEAFSDHKAYIDQLPTPVHRQYTSTRPDPVRQVIIEIENILTQKGKDYASHGDTWVNFRGASDFAGITVEEGMLYRIGEKLERLESLRNIEGEPNFESLEDTMKDIVGYFILLIAYHRQESEKK